MYAGVPNSMANSGTLTPAISVISMRRSILENLHGEKRRSNVSIVDDRQLATKRQRHSTLANPEIESPRGAESDNLWAAILPESTNGDSTMIPSFHAAAVVVLSWSAFVC